MSDNKTTAYRQHRCRHGWTRDQCETCKEIAEKDAEIERLRNEIADLKDEISDWKEDRMVNIEEIRKTYPRSGRGS